MRTAYLERVILGDERGAVSWLVRAALWPSSVVYRIGLAVYLAAYSLGLRKRHRLPVPVISIGNLTFGGTGKTPAVEAVCRMLIEQGFRVTVLSRGYGGSATSPVVVSGGASIRCESAECGDEPLALARALPGVSVVIGKDRRQSGDLACAEFSPDVIVLDDGMQYWQLHRDLDIVVMDAARPFGSGLVMPAGDLREPIGGLRRAGVVLVTGIVGGFSEPDSAVPVGGVSGADRAWGRVQRTLLQRDALVLRCARKPAWLRSRESGQVELSWLAGRKALAFSGIGRPESFVGTLELLGTVMARHLVFPDHHRYTNDDLALIESKRAELGAEAVVTTEKDYARLGPDVPIENLYVLGIELEIEESRRLAERLAAVVDGARKAASS